MKNLYVKPPTEYSRKTKAILYVVTAFIAALLIYINYGQNKMYETTSKTGKRFQTVITNVDCTNGKTRSRLYFKYENNEVKHVNVTYSQCNMFNIGDTISVFVNEKEEWFEIDPTSLN